MAIQKKGRQQKVTEGDGSLKRRGEGLGTGPVGNSQRPSSSTSDKIKEAQQKQQNAQRPAGNVRPAGNQQRPSGSQKTDNKGLVDDLFSTNTSQSSQSSQSSSGLGSGLFSGLTGSSGNNSGGRRGSALSRLIIFVLLILLVYFLIKSCNGGGGLIPGGDSGNNSYFPTSPTQPSSYNPTTPSQTQPVQPSQDSGNNSGGSFTVGSPVSGSSLSSVLSGLGLSDILSGAGTGSYSTGSQAQSTGWSAGKNTGVLNTQVASFARPKRTTLLGSGRDVFTIMVYMCGTDLESKYGMGTSDLQEMLNATTNNNNLNIVVYTGGCSGWKNNLVSSKNNMILQIKGGQVAVLEQNAGQVSMTDPNTLSAFIKYCKDRFPANRNMLILWDHGGGSVSGYGYDEKYKNSGAMHLVNVRKALQNGGVTFDIIGYDACLMATYETALVASEFADYMVASEESEPGVGWYYTDWLKALDRNTSQSSLEIGKNIVDGFVSECARKCAGQTTTLSVVDLAEFAGMQDKLDTFSASANNEVNSNYSNVASSRASSHEFAQGNRIDQVDLVDFAARIGTNETKEFASSLLSAIKYNLTSNGVSNAYGMSVYFPHASRSQVDTAVKIDQSIGMSQAYTNLIRNYASMQTSGQASTAYSLSDLLGGGGASSYQDSYSNSGLGSIGASSLLNMLGGGSNQQSSVSSDVLSGVLGSLLTGGSSSSSSSSSGLDLGSLLGLMSGGSDFLSGRELSDDQAAAYIVDNTFDSGNLNWKEDDNGTPYISMDKEQWELVTDLALSMYYDDGEGYIDLGVDNIYSFDENGNLLAPEDALWLAVNRRLVAYYYENESWDGDEFVINGYIPALLNGEQVRLLVTFDNEHPYGYITGAQPVYKDEDISVQAKAITELQDGDVIDFIADYYTYDGEYVDSFMIGDQLTVNGDLEISSVAVDEGHANMMYRVYDIYNSVYWSEALTN